MDQNTQVKLARRPVGKTNDSTWSIGSHSIPSIQDGEFLVKIDFISLDPAMRGWINDAKSYIPPVKIGEVMRAGAIGTIIKSKNVGFKVNDVVVGSFGVQQYAVSDGKGTTLVPPMGISKEKFLGVLGMPGFTAYFGLLEIGKPKKGETIVVSAAAGAVGSVVGQIGKIKECHVVGIAGGKEKCDYVINELGFDACIDYKSENWQSELKKATPNGIDIYFENVGGVIFDFVLTRLNFKARIPLCGAISQYNSTEIYAPKNYLSLLVNSARLEGFIVFNYANLYPKAMQDLGKWLIEGRIKSEEFIVEGIEAFPETFHRLFSGHKKGKLILKV